MPADSGEGWPTKWADSVCDTPSGNATCQNRYPEIIKDISGKKTLMGFVATGKELFPDFAPDEKNNYCGQCYEIEFHNASNIDNAIVQVTNTGDANGIFDFEVPGGGFGANNGCKGYSAWQVYTSQGGPCDPEKDTCNDSDRSNISGCTPYGGFNNIKYCNTAFGTDEKAKKACTDVLFGVFPPQGNDHCPGFPNNLKIKRYRAVKCPKWHTDKTGPNAAKAPIAVRSRQIGESCDNDYQCSQRNCNKGKCAAGNFQNGKTCSYSNQCVSKYCNTKNICAPLPDHKVCYYNDACLTPEAGTPTAERTKKNCPTPSDYCNKCKKIGIGQSKYLFNKSDTWQSLFKTELQFSNFINPPNNGNAWCNPNDFPQYRT